MQPVRIKRLKDEVGAGTGLEVEWSDGNIVSLNSHSLRAACPCATCQEERGVQTHSNPLGAVSTGRSLLKVVKSTAEEGEDLKQVWSVGNYAIGILWGDGHNSGIFSYDILRRISGPPNG